MTQVRGSGRATDLKELGRKVGQWRAHRGRGRSPVPEELWAEAVSVARRRGLHATARALHFNYYSLKGRMEREANPVAGREMVEFVEIQAPAGATGPVPGRMIIEVQGRQGDRMRIEADPGAVDLASLVQAIRRCGR